MVNGVVAWAAEAGNGDTADREYGAVRADVGDCTALCPGVDLAKLASSCDDADLFSMRWWAPGPAPAPAPAPSEEPESSRCD